MSKVDYGAESYRNWIKGWIKMKGLTQSKFVEKHAGAVSSYPVLMSILNKNRNPSLATFFRLFSPMDLHEEELFFMLLLKLENELDIYDESEMEVRSYLRKMRSKLVPFLRGDYETKLPIDPSFAAFYKAYQVLTEANKEKLGEALRQELRLQAVRQHNRKDAKEAKEAINQLASVLKKKARPDHGSVFARR